MNINTQIAQYAAAQTAAEEARQNLLKRLGASAEIVRNIHRKRFYGQKLPSSLEWINFYRKPDAVITLTGEDMYPVKVESGGKTYRIHRQFVFGSTWDIARDTRRLFYRAQYLRHVAEADELRSKVTDVDAKRAKEIAAIRAEAERKIKEVEKRSYVREAATLAQRDNQIARYQAYVEATTAREAAKSATA